jgi:O-antigen/teichoic acid export membrane protein
LVRVEIAIEQQIFTHVVLCPDKRITENMKRLLKASSMTGGASLFNLLAGAVRIKIVALLLGATGVGVISYLINFAQLAASVTSLGIGSGIVKLTSEYLSEDRNEKVNRLKATAFSITFWFSIFVCAILFAAAKDISVLLIGNAKYTTYVRWVSLSIPFLTFGQSLTSVLNGFRAIRQLALITVWSALVSVLIVAPLVWKFQVTGLVWHFVIQAGLTCVVAILFYRWTLRDPRLLRFLSFQGFDGKIVRALAGFGAATFLIGLFQNLAFLFVRRLIQQHQGELGVGLYQVPYGLTMQYLSIVLTALMTYSLPTLSALHEEKAFHKELNQTMRVSLLAIVPVISMLLLFKKWLILLLYTRDFLPSVGLLEIQLVGDFFKVVAFVFGVAVLARAQLRAWVVLDLIWDICFVGFGVFLYPRIGLAGVAYAFLGAYFVMAIGYAVFAYRSMRISLDWPNVKLLILSVLALVFVAGSARLFLPLAIILVLATLGLWLVLCFERNELKKGLSMLRQLSWREDKTIPLA